MVAILSYVFLCVCVCDVRFLDRRKLALYMGTLTINEVDGCVQWPIKEI